MSDTQAPSAEEQLQELAAAYNLLVRKNRSLLNRLAQSEDKASELEAQAETQISQLQEQNKQLQAELHQQNAPQQSAPTPPQAPVEVEIDNEDTDISVPV